jgi:hypothetical protein
MPGAMNPNAGMSEQEQQMVKAMQMGMESCIGKTVMAGVMGGGLGAMFGLFMASVCIDMVSCLQAKEKARLTCADAIRYPNVTTSPGQHACCQTHNLICWRNSNSRRKAVDNSHEQRQLCFCSHPHHCAVRCAFRFRHRYPPKSNRYRGRRSQGPSTSPATTSWSARHVPIFHLQRTQLRQSRRHILRH